MSQQISISKFFPKQATLLQGFLVSPAASSQTVMQDQTMWLWLSWRTFGFLFFFLFLVDYFIPSKLWLNNGDQRRRAYQNKNSLFIESRFLDEQRKTHNWNSLLLLLILWWWVVVVTAAVVFIHLCNWPFLALITFLLYAFPYSEQSSIAALCVVLLPQSIFFHSGFQVAHLTTENS